MSNTSKTNDYVLPVGDIPAYDDELDAILQRYVVGITGLQGKCVRPRWQTKPPKQPPVGVSWCAVGVINTDSQMYPVIEHFGTDPTNPDDGHDVLSRHEKIEVLASFYGPHAQGFCSSFEDGCLMPQNNDQLRKHGMAFISKDSIRAVPTLQNNQWLKRYDIRLFFRRKVSRTYQIRNIASAHFEINKD